MEEKPITDKDNFPPEEKTRALHVVVPATELAYADGCSDGYRKAVTDFLLWSLAFFCIAILARSISIE